MNCNENAKCEMTARGSHECKCLAGFHGDGYACTTQTCDTLNNCDQNADCLIDSLSKQSRCVCRNGYIGNGYECAKDGQNFLKKIIFFVFFLNLNLDLS
jgi:hypothetical protein